ncbi:MAG: hypothetical protein ABIJ16_08320 [Bacteroidota bacterium]
MLFYLDVNRGAPSYNMGFMYGRITIKNDSGTFYKKYEYCDNACQWQMTFTKKSLVISTVDYQYDCGFGNAVYADGEFKRKSSDIPEFFESPESTKIFFRDTKPEDY